MYQITGASVCIYSNISGTLLVINELDYSLLICKHSILKITYAFWLYLQHLMDWFYFLCDQSFEFRSFSDLTLICF